MARGLMTWNPWGELDEFENALDRWFGPARRPWSSQFPPVNVWSGEDEAVLLAEVPGVDPDNMEITVKENTVTLRGSREAAEPAEGQTFVRRERETGAFSRTLRLPFRVDADKVSAEYHRGVLELRLPRSETDKPKKITVTAK